jgi:hypothetical protein
MTARERAHVLIDEFSDAELEEIVGLLRVHREKAEPEIAELPEAWKNLGDGTPAPNWVAGLHEARRDADADS